MTSLQILLESVESARRDFVAECEGLSPAQVNFKPDPESWSILDNVEHIVRAEQSGISGLWKALDGFKRAEPIWQGDPIHRGLSVEEIVEQTWQTKEKVPPIAAPQWGGSLNFWLAMCRAQRYMLQDLVQEMEGLDLELIIFPHPISGPMDARQRLEFLRFHARRHQEQVRRIKGSEGYPAE